MKNLLRFTNLSIGILVVILFVITGQLMRHYYFNETAPDVERMYRRSRHLYLLLAGLAQGGIGVYIVAHKHQWPRLIQWGATGLMSLAAGMLVYSFFFEIPHEIVKTPVSKLAMYLLLGSTSLHLVSSLLNQYQSKKNPA